MCNFFLYASKKASKNLNHLFVAKFPTFGNKKESLQSATNLKKNFTVALRNVFIETISSLKESIGLSERMLKQKLG